MFQIYIYGYHIHLNADLQRRSRTVESLHRRSSAGGVLDGARQLRTLRPRTEPGRSPEGGGDILRGVPGHTLRHRAARLVRGQLRPVYGYTRVTQAPCTRLPRGERDGGSCCPARHPSGR